MKGWAAEMTRTFGFSEELSERIVKSGINSPSAFQGVSADDLVDIGFEAEEAASIMDKVDSHLAK